MSAPFLSVILPAYNRKYCISRMIDTVLMQSFGDFELIIIDDGSNDGTKEMLEEKYYDKRIKIVYQENGGVSSARNLGISLAKGEYITFVDSDDYLLDGFFEDIHENLKDCQYEILVYGGYILKNHTQIEAPLFWRDREYGQNGIIMKHSEDFVKDFCLLGGNSWGCAKVFKTSLILKHRVLFDTRITYGEDMFFNLQAYLSSSQILTSPKKFYVCDNNAESLSRGMLTLKEKCKNLLLVYENLEGYEDYRAYFALNTLRHIRYLLWSVSLSNDKQLKDRIVNMVPLASSCKIKLIENIGFRLMKKSIFIASLLFHLHSAVYSRITHIYSTIRSLSRRF